MSLVAVRYIAQRWRAPAVHENQGFLLRNRGLYFRPSRQRSWLRAACARRLRDFNAIFHLMRPMRSGAWRLKRRAPWAAQRRARIARRRAGCRGAA